MVNVKYRLACKSMSMEFSDLCALKFSRLFTMIKEMCGRHLMDYKGMTPVFKKQATARM